MEEAKRKRLEAAGYRVVDDAADFLQLTQEERRLVELRLSLSRTVRHLREQMNVTQQELARRIKSSQSRVARLEAADAGVSLDLLFRGFFAVGGQMSDLAAESGPHATGTRKAPRTTRKTPRKRSAGKVVG